jgi:hypothetical protein
MHKERPAMAFWNSFLYFLFGRKKRCPPEKKSAESLRFLALALTHLMASCWNSND